MTIPQAAGITGTLTAAGLSSSAVSEWFNTPRAELGLPGGENGWMTWLTPKLALELQGPGAAPRVLAMAVSDAASIGEGLPRGWEGTD